MSGLRHWHGTPSEMAEPEECCVRLLRRRLDEAERRWECQLGEAVTAERRRTAGDAVQAIGVYGDAVASVLTEPEATLARTITSKAIEAIKRTGCICGHVDITTGDGRHVRSVRDTDHRCGMHDEEPGQ